MKGKDMEKVLVTGGAGFIGSHTVDLLITQEYDVTILDNLEPQVHGAERKHPAYLNKDATFVLGDVRERELLEKLVSENDAIIHLASVVGVGQSMYEIERYVGANTQATAVLLDILANEDHNVRKLVVASSMSLYGEGKYRCEKCGSDVFPDLRTEQQLVKKLWEHLCPSCGSALKPLPTDEEKPLMPTSIYAMSKRHQEEMCLLVGKTYGISTVALRYFNVYGSRQSLSNPYTGVCAIFSSRILNDKPPYTFEDGNQLRDFIHVKDIAQATLNALEYDNANNSVVNVGTGSSVSILKLAEMLIDLYGTKLKPHVSRDYRKGDVRHCYADTQRAERLLNFKAKTNLKEGLVELAEWAKAHGWRGIDLFQKSLEELDERKLVNRQ